MSNKKRELIEILLDNITPDDWPEDAKWAAQDKETMTWGKNKLMFYNQDEPPFAGTGSTRFSGNMNWDNVIQLPELCKNWSKAIITRDEFVKRWNERNPVDDSEGWIQWNGGEMPVEKGTLIDVKYRDGQINEHVKAGFVDISGTIAHRCAGTFIHYNRDSDIVAYRIRRATNATTPPAQQEGHTEETKPIQQEVKATDTQIGGNHYTKLAIQPMRYSMENGLDALQHTVIKYVTRFRDKNGIEDLEKAKHCIDMLIEFERNKS